MREVARLHGLAGHRGLVPLPARAGRTGCGRPRRGRGARPRARPPGRGLRAARDRVVVSRQVPAVLALARGDLAEATTRYAEFAVALRSIGAFSVDALEWIAAWLIAYQAGRADEAAEAAEQAAAVYPPVVPLLVRSLLVGGRRRRGPRRARPPHPPAPRLAAVDVRGPGRREHPRPQRRPGGPAGGVRRAAAVHGRAGRWGERVLRHSARSTPCWPGWRTGSGGPTRPRRSAPPLDALAARVGNPRWVAAADAVRAVVLATD